MVRQRKAVQGNAVQGNAVQRSAMEWNGMEWNGMEWNGMGWNGMEWNRMEWNGMEWNAAVCIKIMSSNVIECPSNTKWSRTGSESATCVRTPLHGHSHYITLYYITFEWLLYYLEHRRRHRQRDRHVRRRLVPRHAALRSLGHREPDLKRVERRAEPYAHVHDGSSQFATQEADARSHKTEPMLMYAHRSPRM